LAARLSARAGTGPRIDRTIFLATQHDATVDEPSPEQIYRVGTLGAFCSRKNRRTARSKSSSKAANAPRLFASRILTARSPRSCVARPSSVKKARDSTLWCKSRQLIEQHLRLAPDVQTDALQTALRNQEPSHLADALASQLRISVEDKQGCSNLLDPGSAARLIELLETELEKRQLDRTIQTRVKRQMEKAQKEYYLNEQIKAIHKELGRKDEKAELEELKKKIEEAGMTEEAKEKAMQELHRLEAMPPMSAEGTVSRTYIDWLVSVPWKQKSKEIKDLSKG
jgi:ATP-dependent Lon protease